MEIITFYCFCLQGYGQALFGDVQEVWASWGNILTYCRKIEDSDTKRGSIKTSKANFYDLLICTMYLACVYKKHKDNKLLSWNVCAEKLDLLLSGWILGGIKRFTNDFRLQNICFFQILSVWYGSKHDIIIRRQSKSWKHVEEYYLK